MSAVGGMQLRNAGWTETSDDWTVLGVGAVLCLAYASTLALVLGWCGWSISKHGWRKRDLRRTSYILFALFLLTRVAWCALLMAEGAGVMPLASDAEAGATVALGETARLLTTPTARLLDGVASCLHFSVLSLLVCGWAESWFMMSATSSMQPAPLRNIFYHYWPAYMATNGLFVALMALALAPLICAPHDDAWVGFGAQYGIFVTAGFSLLLAVASIVAGKRHLHFNTSGSRDPSHALASFVVSLSSTRSPRTSPLAALSPFLTFLFSSTPGSRIPSDGAVASVFSFIFQHSPRTSPLTTLSLSLIFSFLVFNTLTSHMPFRSAVAFLLFFYVSARSTRTSPPTARSPFSFLFFFDTLEFKVLCVPK